MGKLSAGTVLRLGLGAARRRWTLLLPLWVADLAATLLAFVPALVLAVPVARLLSAALVDERPLRVLDRLLDPELWAVYGAGLLLAALGGWLVHTTLRAGVIRSIWAELTADASPGDPFLRGIIERPHRWLVAGAAAALLRMFAAVCGLGSVAASMAWFRSEPGAGPALAMTVSTAMLLAVPLLDAALEVGFVRALTVSRGAFSALGEGVLLTFRRARVLLPVWYLFVVASLVVSVLGLAGAAASAIPGSGLGAHLVSESVAWIVGAVAAGLVTLGRLATYAAAVAWDEDALPAVDAVETSNLSVYEAVELPQPPDAPA